MKIKLFFFFCICFICACASNTSVMDKKNDTKTKIIKQNIPAKDKKSTNRIEYTKGVAALINNGKNRQEYKNEVVCKREIKTGTKIPVRVCRTRAEIEKDRENAKRELSKTPSNKKVPRGGVN